MEFLIVSRQLARHRVLVALGALLAIAVCLAVAGMLPGAGGAPAATGLARGRVLIDTPSSLVGDAGASADAIGGQASLLTDLLTGADQQQRIARAAGVPAGSLVVVRPAALAPIDPSNLGEDASIAGSAPALYTVTLQVQPDLPIVTFQAAAPTREAAQRLDDAAMNAMRALVAARAPTPSRALAVRTFEPVRAVTVSGKSAAKRMALGVIAGLLLFTFWVSGIVVAGGVARALRRVPAEEGAP
jgi:hypothetical protein